MKPARVRLRGGALGRRGDAALGEDARVLAGGQSLVPLLNAAARAPRADRRHQPDRRPGRDPADGRGAADRGDRAPGRARALGAGRARLAAARPGDAARGTRRDAVARHRRGLGDARRPARRAPARCRARRAVRARSSGRMLAPTSCCSARHDRDRASRTARRDRRAAAASGRPDRLPRTPAHAAVSGPRRGAAVVVAPGHAAVALLGAGRGHARGGRRSSRARGPARPPRSPRSPSRACARRALVAELTRRALETKTPPKRAAHDAHINGGRARPRSSRARCFRTSSATAA